MAYEHADHAPLDLGPVSAADIALLRPPTAMWGYNMQVTDEALDRIARAMRERDVTIAYLQEQLAALVRNGAWDEPRAGTPARSRDPRGPREPAGAGNPGVPRSKRVLRGGRPPGVSAGARGPGIFPGIPSPPIRGCSRRGVCPGARGPGFSLGSRARRYRGCSRLSRTFPDIASSPPTRGFSPGARAADRGCCRGRRLRRSRSRARRHPGLPSILGPRWFSKPPRLLRLPNRMR